MSELPPSIAEFLASRRIAVAGVSRQGSQPANAIFRRLRDTGHDVMPVNPRADTVEGVPCFASVEAVPGAVDALVVASPPGTALALVEQAAARGVRSVWFHRSFGQGSVEARAADLCRTRGLACIVGGCPLMFCGRVDVVHRCMRWWLQRRGRVPR